MAFDAGVRHGDAGLRRRCWSAVASSPGCSIRNSVLEAHLTLDEAGRPARAEHASTLLLGRVTAAAMALTLAATLRRRASRHASTAGPAGVGDRRRTDGAPTHLPVADPEHAVEPSGRARGPALPTRTC